MQIFGIFSRHFFIFYSSLQHYINTSGNLHDVQIPYLAKISKTKLDNPNDSQIFSHIAIKQQQKITQEWQNESQTGMNAEMHQFNLYSYHRS